MSASAGFCAVSLGSGAAQACACVCVVWLVCVCHACQVFSLVPQRARHAANATSRHGRGNHGQRQGGSDVQRQRRLISGHQAGKRPGLGAWASTQGSRGEGSTKAGKGPALGSLCACARTCCTRGGTNRARGAGVTRHPCLGGQRHHLGRSGLGSMLTCVGT